MFGDGEERGEPDRRGNSEKNREKNEIAETGWQPLREVRGRAAPSAAFPPGPTPVPLIE